MKIKPGAIIAVINNKGGVGKTTVATNLAYGLSQRGYNTALVDFDSQANSTSIILKGMTPTYTIFDLLNPEQPEPIEKCICTTRFKNLKIIASEDKLAYLEFELISQQLFNLPKELIRPYCRDNFDISVIDCPPNVLYFSLAALRMCDYIIVPVVPQSRFSIEGLVRLNNFATKYASEQNPDLKSLKVVVNKLDNRMSLAKIILSDLQSILTKEKMFNTMIPTTSLIEHAEYMQELILTYSRSSKGARAYRQLTKEIEDMING